MRTRTATGCPTADNLKSYVDGELGPLERIALRRHLSGCAACEAELQSLGRLGAALRSLEGHATPPAGLRDRVLARLEFQPEAPVRRVSRYDAIRWSAALATAVIAGVVTIPALIPARESARGPRAQQSAAPSATGGAVPSTAAGGGSPGMAPPSGGAESERGAFPGAPGYAALEPRSHVSTSSEFTTDAHAAPEAPLSGVDFQRNGDPYARSIRWPRDLDGRIEEMAKAPVASRARRLPATPSRALPGVTPNDVERYTRGREMEEVKRKVKQDASLSLRVSRRLEEVQDSIAERVKRDGGYVEDSNLTAPTEGERTSRMSLRVPVEKFEAALAWLSSLGEVKVKNVTGEDITGTWIDQRAEVRELRAEEARLLKEFGKATNSREREAARAGLLTVRPRIAAAEERFALTGKLAALGTVDLTLTEEPQARVQGNLMRDLDGTTRHAVSTLIAAVRIPASVLIWLVVFSPLWLPCVLVYRWAGRKAAAERLRRYDPEAAAELGY